MRICIIVGIIVLLLVIIIPSGKLANCIYVFVRTDHLLTSSKSCRFPPLSKAQGDRYELMKFVGLAWENKDVARVSPGKAILKLLSNNISTNWS